MSKVVDQRRLRIEPGKNYVGIYSDREITRMYEETIGDIEATTVPELMDIKLTNACNGDCPYCYQSSISSGLHAEDPIGRLEGYFAGVPEDLLPFQVALGGGDPLLHPEFPDICAWFASKGVVPNATTNGMNFNQRNLQAIEDFCGGIAVTAHRHLDYQWRQGFKVLERYCEMPAIHVLYHDAASIGYVRSIVSEYSDRAYTIVMLPMIAQGRASSRDILIDKKALDAFVDGLSDEELMVVSWGAMAYDYFKEQPRLKKSLSLYEPEIFSRYLDLTTMKEYPSSFAVASQ